MHFVQSRSKFVLLLALLLGSCSNSSTQIQSQPAPVTGVVQDQPGPEQPEDHSLNTEKYIRLGLPSPDRAWTASEMARVAKVLETIAGNEPSQLPRYNSKQSGEVFARITSRTNLEFYRERSIPIDLRVSQAAMYLRSLAQITEVYFAGYRKKTTGDSEFVDLSEFVELYGTNLYADVVLFELAEEFAPTLKKDDPTYFYCVVYGSM